VKIAPGVVAVLVDGPLKIERVSSGERSPGLLVIPVISVDTVAEETFCASGSSLLAGSRIGGRSCLLCLSQETKQVLDRKVLTDVLVHVLKMVDRRCKPTIDECIYCKGWQYHHPYTLLFSSYNHRMPRQDPLSAWVPMRVNNIESIATFFAANVRDSERSSNSDNTKVWRLEYF